MTKPKLLLTFLFLVLMQFSYAQKQRLLVLADMGNEPDEVQQMVHMIMYSNEFDVEGLIAVSGKYLHSAHRLPERTRLYPDLFYLIIDAFEKDLENLGNTWPLRIMGAGHIHFLEGGGTIPWMGLIHNGLSDISHPHWGGWSGRFTKGKVKNEWSRHTDIQADEEKYGDFYLYTEAVDTWIDPESGHTYNNEFTPVWRWRRAMYNDIKCRMDWCVEDYENANHNPVAAINGDSTEKIHFMETKPVQTINLEASASSDPDGDDLEFKWWIYPEAGSYIKKIELQNSQRPKLAFQIPEDAGGTEIHLILEINDINEIANLSDYRRVVINVN